jgi:hypothetical protein
MASISINTVPRTGIYETKRLVAVSAQGNVSTIPISSILSQVDSGIAERVEEQVLNSVDTQIEVRVEQIMDNATSINKEDVDTIFNS